MNSFDRVFDLSAEAERFLDRKHRQEQLARRKHNDAANKAMWRQRDKARHGMADFAPDGTPVTLGEWRRMSAVKALNDADARKNAKLRVPAPIATVCAALDAMTDASGYGMPHLRTWSLIQHLHGRGFVRSEDIMRHVLVSNSRGSLDNMWLQAMLRCLRKCGAVVMDRSAGYTLSFQTSRGDDVDMELAIGTWIEWASRNRNQWPKPGQRLVEALELAIRKGWYRGTMHDARAIASKALRVNQ